MLCWTCLYPIKSTAPRRRKWFQPLKWLPDYLHKHSYFLRPPPLALSSCEISTQIYMYPGYKSRPCDQLHKVKYSMEKWSFTHHWLFYLKLLFVPEIDEGKHFQHVQEDMVELRIHFTETVFMLKLNVLFCTFLNTWSTCKECGHIWYFHSSSMSLHYWHTNTLTKTLVYWISLK